MDDAFLVTYNLLNSLKIKYNKEVLDKLLSEHPNYPSLAAVKETIEKYGIETEPVKMDVSVLEDESFPLISLLNYPTDRFILIEGYDKKEDIIKYKLSENQAISENLDSFNKKWSGIAIRIKKGKQAKEKNYYKNKFLNKHFVLLFFFILFSIAGFFSLIPLKNVSYVFLIIPKIAGLYVSYLLTLKDNFADNTWLSKICKANMFFDCEKISNSKYKRIFDFINLSDLIAAYFTFTIVLFLAGIHSEYLREILLTLFVLNIFGLPFIAYSVYVQYFKLKVFCPLCILLSLIFLSETFVFIFSINFTSFRIQYLFSPESLISISVLAFVLYLMNLLLKLWQERLSNFEKTHDWFMNLPGIMEFALNNQKEIELSINNDDFVGIYNPDSNLKITLIVFSDCLYCKSLAYQIDKFVSQSPANISIDLRFNSSNEISTYLTGIFQSYENSLKSWDAYIYYMKHGFENLKIKYSVEKIVLEKSRIINENHVNWCSENGIFSAPILYINSKLIPNILIHNNSIFDYLTKLGISN